MHPSTRHIFLILLGLIATDRANCQQADRQATQIERPRDIDRYHVDRVNLASDVPPYHSFYVWRASLESVTGKTGGGGSIPVYRWDEWTDEMVVNAELPVGTEIKLDILKVFAYHNYFRIAQGKDPRGQEKYGWIDGSYITRDDNDSRTYKPVRDKKRLHFPKK